MDKLSANLSHRILIIDDNVSIHEDFRKILKNNSDDTGLDDMESALFDSEPKTNFHIAFEIDCAPQGRDGLAMVERAMADGRPYSLAFVDVRMPPGWDGIETIGYIWKACPDLQVVLCTAYADYSWLKIQEILGVSDSLLILKKPFDNVEVLQMAHALSRKWELDRELRNRIDKLKIEINNRQKTEESLKASEEKFRSVVENIGVGISLISPNMKIMTINNQMKKWFPDVDISQMPCCYEAFNDPPEENMCPDCPVYKTFQDKQVNESILKKYLDDDIKYYRVIASPIIDEAGNIIAAIEMVEDITERKRIESALRKRERDLKNKSQNLEELNAALKVLLIQREKDRDELEENMMANIKKLAMPLVEKLKKSCVKKREADYVNILEANLRSIMTPFSSKLTSPGLNLTPKEIQIANLIKEGNSNKDIAEIMSISVGTIKFHRENIRIKLELGTKDNLRSYLLKLT